MVRKRTTKKSSMRQTASTTVEFSESLMDTFIDWNTEGCEEISADVNRREGALSQFVITLEDQKLAFLLSLTEEQKNMKVDLDDEKVHELFSLAADMTNTITVDSSESPEKEMKPPTTVIRRRSRSAASRARATRARSRESSVSSTTAHRRVTRLRSISVEANYETPQSRPILSKMATASKYTVSKPAREKENALHLRRMMKPSEEAISTSGSPLFVNPMVSGPVVTIPLPDGLVMNLEARRRRPREVPELDEATKESIQILIEQLKYIKESK